MKQKIMLLVIVILLLLTATLGYWVYTHNQAQQQQALQNQQAIQKQIADLNDRLVAVARQQGTGSNSANPVNATQTMQLSPSQQQQFNQQRSALKQQQRQWTQDALHLAQDSLNHGDEKKSQQILLQLQQNLIESQQDFGNIFTNTLLQTLKIDQLNIAQQANRLQQQRTSLSNQLLQAEQQLNLMAVRAPASFDTQLDQPKGIGSGLKQLLIIQRTTPDAAKHMLDRTFVYKQASMDVAIARLALAQHDAINFASSMDDALSQLNLLGDLTSQKLALSLKEIRNQPWPVAIELTSLTLLDGQKRAS